MLGAGREDGEVELDKETVKLSWCTREVTLSSRAAYRHAFCLL